MNNSASLRRSSMMLLTLVSLFGLTMCRTTDTKETEPDPHAVCAVWRYISWAHHTSPTGVVAPEKSDTLQTIYEVKQNNAARKVFCKDEVSMIDSAPVVELRGMYEPGTNTH